MPGTNASTLAGWAWLELGWAWLGKARQAGLGWLAGWGGAGLGWLIGWGRVGWMVGWLELGWLRRGWPGRLAKVELAGAKRGQLVGAGMGQGRSELAGWAGTGLAGAGLGWL